MTTRAVSSHEVVGLLAGGRFPRVRWDRGAPRRGVLHRAVGDLVSFDLFFFIAFCAGFLTFWGNITMIAVGDRQWLSFGGAAGSTAVMVFCAVGLGWIHS